MTGGAGVAIPPVPHQLRVEHLDEPLGIHTVEPRLSWQLPDGASRQTGYRITTDNGWDSGWIEDDRQLLVPYGGPALRSAQRVDWRVAVRTDLGESAPSAPGWFETGLLWADDWEATWVEPGDVPQGTAGYRPGVLLRHAFDVDRPVATARLHATAQGLYEGFLNGARIGDAELTPGFTQYDERLQVQTFDVTKAIRSGCNVIGVILTDGWFRGQLGVTRAADQWGDRLAFLCQLQLTHPDGSVTVLGTGPSWRSAVGHVVMADLIAGQSVDLRRLPRGWDRPDFDDSSWAGVTAVSHGFAGLVGSPAPPVRRIQEIAPLSVSRLPGGRQIVDLGQNINGWLRLTDLGPAGTRIVLTHGEILDAAGDVDVRNLQPALPFLPAPLPAGQVDEVVSAGVAGDTFEPRHTTHGFRYVRIEGHPGDLTPAEVTGIVVHTDMRRTGWFTCSDDRMNRLHDAAVWSFRGNACDIPTDCPHRERAGWTGDWQLYVPTAAFLYDVAGLSNKWLLDVAADQWPDGTIANISPTLPAEGRDSPIAFLNGSAGWGDAVVLVPWQLYRAYGDVDILGTMWPAMVAWLDRAERMARTGRHPSRRAARPEPAAHEQYLWDTGFHWGEWLVPGDDSAADLAAFAGTDKGDVATAYFAHSSRVMSLVAGVLGFDDQSVRYGDLADRVTDAWRAEYLGNDGTLTPDTQANHVRALAFDLVPVPLRPAVADRLVTLIRSAGTHLGTGFLATPDLLPVLADHGHSGVAYDVLFQDTEPSWLTMIDRGATTMWEAWDGVGADGIAHDSLNHYSKGAVISFLHRHVAGIRLLAGEPAYRRFRVQPEPGGGLSWARAAHESPYGRIEVAWELAGHEITVSVTVPAGSSAEVVLPDGTTSSIGPGTHTLGGTVPTGKPELLASTR